MKLNINLDAHKALGIKKAYKEGKMFRTFEVSDKQLKSLGEFNFKKELQKEKPRRIFKYKHFRGTDGMINKTEVAMLVGVSNTSGLITFNKVL